MYYRIMIIKRLKSMKVCFKCALTIQESETEVDGIRKVTEEWNDDAK